MLRLLKSIFLFLFLFVTFVFAEDITITTYYPSPFGCYKNLSIYNQDESTTQTDFTRALTRAGGLITTDYTANAYTPGIFWSTQNNNATKPKAGIYLMETNTGSRMYFGTSNDYATGITNNAIVIDEVGNIGIGVTGMPAQKLHVAGNIMGAAPDGTNTWRWDRLAGADPWVRLYTASTSTYNNLAVGPFWANGATRFDLAEVTPVRKEEALEVADVVCIDKEAKVRMRRSQKAYDPLVSGIVSDPNTASMVIGGDTSPEEISSINDKKPIGLVGRVLCKVSTENGPIEIGDLLVTSSKPGYAMKASMDKLKPGMVLGKAMESLKDGEGKIIVWITLQ